VAVTGLTVYRRL